MSQDITKVGVLGAGTMGHGIAQVCAQAGCTTALYDVSAELVQQGLATIGKNLDVGVEKKKVTAEDRAATLGRLSASTALKDLQGCQLVIEAIPEKMSLKQATFKELSSICEPSAILASNTSSLS